MTPSGLFFVFSVNAVMLGMPLSILAQHTSVNAQNVDGAAFSSPVRHVEALQIADRAVHIYLTGMWTLPGDTYISDPAVNDGQPFALPIPAQSLTYQSGAYIVLAQPTGEGTVIDTDSWQTVGTFEAYWDGCCVSANTLSLDDDLLVYQVAKGVTRVAQLPSLGTVVAFRHIGLCPNDAVDVQSYGLSHCLRLSKTKFSNQAVH